MEKINKMKIKGVICIGFVLFLLSFGCVSLEEKPMDFPGPDNFYATEDQIISGLTGAMGALYSQWGNYSYGWGVFEDDANSYTSLAFTSGHANWVWRAHYTEAVCSCPT